ncbi:MAG: hypothetical protein PHG67_12170 [Bacteroidales bacterium]|nr:hypothetical protein [Bacteroidales bacterium]
MKLITLVVICLVWFAEARAHQDKQLFEKIALINNITDLFNKQYKAGSGIGCSFGLQGNIREWDSTSKFTLSYQYDGVDWKSTQIQAEADNLSCLEARCKGNQTCFTLTNSKNKRKTYRSAQLFCVPDEQKQVLNALQSSLLLLSPYFE